jgi:hypothetical protein
MLCCSVLQVMACARFLMWVPDIIFAGGEVCSFTRATPCVCVCCSHFRWCPCVILCGRARTISVFMSPVCFWVHPVWEAMNALLLVWSELQFIFVFRTLEARRQIVVFLFCCYWIVVLFSVLSCVFSSVCSLVLRHPSPVMESEKMTSTCLRV